MKSRRDMVLKAFLDQCNPKKKDALKRFLPEKELHQLDSLPLLEEEADLNHFYNGHLLEDVHWSWFLPTLKLYPESEQKLFITALDSRLEKNLAKTRSEE